ncbi:MAG TPA: isoprenylcysteine carboxylmethyltransferase family protein [Desulfatiglandales bacterium]|nr:isoprenylcysteine carboxylmethyltransferase family protein [Desulfatiglandales bacterium]
MHWGLVKTIIVLPGTVLVFIPASILLITQDSRFAAGLVSPAQIWFWLALLPASVGLVLCAWSATLFMKFGAGTPAPWHPPKKLVVRGPYRYIRNPMITGVLLILLAEAVLLQSWPIAIWMMVFFIGNPIYFPLIEEKGLEKRFGNEYRNYKAHVPRWIPHLKTWTQASDDEQHAS